MASLDAVGIVCADLAKSVKFYSLLGLQFTNTTEDHIEAKAPNGMRVMLDKLELIQQIDPEWVQPVGQRMSMAFRCASPDDVNATFARIVQSGFRSKDTHRTTCSGVSATRRSSIPTGTRSISSRS